MLNCLFKRKDLILHLHSTFITFYSYIYLAALVCSYFAGLDFTEKCCNSKMMLYNIITDGAILLLHEYVFFWYYFSTFP